MKACTYCGKEYPDEATVCATDGQTLLDPAAPTDSASESPIPIAADPPASAPGETRHLTFPDYQWRALDAWKCLGFIVISSFALIGVNRFLYTHFPTFYRSGAGVLTISVLHYSLGVLTAIYLARTETLSSFVKAFGLDQKLSRYVWFGIVMALAIRFVGHLCLSHGWSHGVHSSDATMFRHAIGFKKFSYLIRLVVLAPLLEEFIYRGFVYKAFRKSYPIVMSVLLLVAWAAYSHRTYYSESWIAAVDISVLTVIQCSLREKSPSLWDTIICHFVFNASALLV